MKVLLVDDEKLQLLRLRQCVEESLGDPSAELFCYTNPLEAWKECEGKDIDLAFLDIEMPGITGVQLAKRLKGKNPRLNIIFVTAYDQYALDAYRVHASGYVMKPVSKQKVKEELENLRNPIMPVSDKKLQIKCFGNFEVFHNGEPVRFSYKKSKELFAYLVDREGSAINVSELNAVLWEEDHPSYLRNLIFDIQSSLRKIGAEEVFVKRHNECYIDVDLVECDAYEYKKDNPNAVRMYRGEYMIQYDWAFFHGQ